MSEDQGTFHKGCYLQVSTCKPQLTDNKMN